MSLLRRKQRWKKKTKLLHQKNEILQLKSQLLAELAKNEKLPELLKQKTAKVNTLACELKESREELVTVKKEKNASITKFKTLEKEFASQKQHIIEINQTLKDLEKEVKEKANTVKVKEEI